MLALNTTVHNNSKIGVLNRFTPKKYKRNYCCSKHKYFTVFIILKKSAVLGESSQGKNGTCTNHRFHSEIISLSLMMRNTRLGFINVSLSRVAHTVHLAGPDRPRSTIGPGCTTRQELIRYTIIGPHLWVPVATDRIVRPGLIVDRGLTGIFLFYHWNTCNTTLVSHNYSENGMIRWCRQHFDTTECCTTLKSLLGSSVGSNMNTMKHQTSHKYDVLEITKNKTKTSRRLRQDWNMV